MDAATYRTIAAMCPGNGSGGDKPAIEYWNTDLKNEKGDIVGGWSTEKPPQPTIRIPGIVHEAATAYVGKKEDGGSLDEYYRPHGIKNVVCIIIAKAPCERYACELTSGLKISSLLEVHCSLRQVAGTLPLQCADSHKTWQESLRKGFQSRKSLCGVERA